MVWHCDCIRSFTIIRALKSQVDEISKCETRLTRWFAVRHVTSFLAVSWKRIICTGVKMFAELHQGSIWSIYNGKCKKILIFGIKFLIAVQGNMNDPKFVRFWGKYLRVSYGPRMCWSLVHCTECMRLYIPSSCRVILACVIICGWYEVAVWNCGWFCIR